MGHEPGFPCLHKDENHNGRCSTAIPAGFVDLARTRYFDVAGNYWRTNHMAAPGYQVEFQRQDGTWVTASSYPTEWLFLGDLAGQWREITAAETVGGGGPDAA